MALPARPGGGPEAAYAQAFKDVNSHVSLDSQWSKVKAAIESHCGLLGKQPAVKVRNWVKKLSEETANVVWKKNRNAYARLLLEQLRCGRLSEPFSMQPPGGPLPTLPKHLAYAFKPPRSSGSPRAAAHGGQAQWEDVMAQEAQLQQRHEQQQALQPPRRQPCQGADQAALDARLSASEQLDAYLGRASFRRVQHADEQAAVSPTAAWPRAAGSGDGADVSGGLRHLPGTRMQLRGAEGRRVDRHQLEDVGWQPSKLELEAQLGASRERQMELEWRLGHMEGVLRQNGMLLHGQAAAPLGSLLDAIDDGHVSPPRERSNKKELEELIERYEAKKRQWQSPGWASAAAGRPAASSARRAPPIQHSDDVEILQQLDNFQQQTEAIRRHLGGGGEGGSNSGSLPGFRQQQQPPGSSLAANTGNGSDWELLLESTPVRQHPTGLRGSGYTPHPAAAGGRSMALFDGLPPSPAALVGSRQPGNRHVQHAGHHVWHSSYPQQQQQQQQPIRQGQPAAQQVPAHPAASAAQQSSGSSSRLASLSVAAQQQQPRSPIGPDIRHTKKSAAAAEKASAAAQPKPGAAAALHRLKSKRQSAVGAVLSPTGQEPQLDAAGGSPLVQQQVRQDAGVQALHLQHDEGVQVREAGDAGTQVPTPPAPPQPPTDSNAALVAEVRELRSKLLASLQKHAPELAAAGIQPGSSSLASALKWQAEQQAADSSHGGGSWRLAAAPPAAAVAAPQQPPASAFASQDSRQPTDSWGSDWPASVAAAASVSAAAAASSRDKFRLTDDLSSSGREELGGAGRHHLTDLSSYGGGGGLTPSSLLGGGSSLARLGSLEPSAGISSGGLSRVESGFDLGGFEAQTEALRQRLAGF